jgi:hypothetical protein
MARQRFSPSLVVACVALAVALGGTAYAATALPENSVGTPQLKANAVNGKKVKNKSLGEADVKQGTLAFGKTVHVSALAFRPRSPATEVDGTTENGCVFVTAGNLEFLAAQVWLPQGAEVRKVAFSLVDNSSAQNIALRFTRYRPGTAGSKDFIYGQSVSQSPSLREQAFSGAPITVVNNNTWAYVLQVRLPTPSGFVFCGARVEYTLD